MKDLEEITSDYWNSGSNCAQSSACGLLKFFSCEVDIKSIHDLMLTYGGGVGEKSICGAILGSIGAMNVILAKKNVNYDEIREISKQFKKTFTDNWDSLQCITLLDAYLDENGDIKESLAASRKDNCTKIVLSAVYLAKGLIEKSIE